MSRWKIHVWAVFLLTRSPGLFLVYECVTSPVGLTYCFPRWVFPAGKKVSLIFEKLFELLCVWKFTYFRFHETTFNLDRQRLTTAGRKFTRRGIDEPSIRRTFFRSYLTLFNLSAARKIALIRKRPARIDGPDLALFPLSFLLTQSFLPSYNESQGAKKRVSFLFTPPFPLFIQCINFLSWIHFRKLILIKFVILHRSSSKKVTAANVASKSTHTTEGRLAGAPTGNHVAVASHLESVARRRGQ